MASAHEMVQRCFRHQHPECYGRAEVAEPAVPTELRYGNEPAYVRYDQEDLPVSDRGRDDARRD